MNYRVDILKTPEIKTKEYKRFKTEDKTLQEIIDTFISVLEKNISKNNLKLLYNNISSLKIESKSILLQLLPGIFRDNITTGQYYLDDNIISILPIKDKNILNRFIGTNLEEYIANLYHELLHMSSTISNREKNVVFSGFSQIGKIGIGVALDEAYTEIVLYRHFNLNKEYMTYDYEISITMLIEEMIGQDKMKALYFNANLYGLVEELEKYNIKENITSFIEALDVVHILCDHSRKYRKDIIYYHNEISKFLVDTYLNKLKLDKLSNIEYDYKLNKFLNSIHVAFEKLEVESVKRKLREK